jgi:uncharacterized membrane protein
VQCAEDAEQRHRVGEQLPRRDVLSGSADKRHIDGLGQWGAGEAGDPDRRRSPLAGRGHRLDRVPALAGVTDRYAHVPDIERRRPQLLAQGVRRHNGTATLVATLTGVTIAVYTVLDGLGVRHAHNTLGYITLLFLLQGPVLTAIAGFTLRHRLRTVTSRDVTAGLAAGALSLVAYGIVIWAQTHGPLALVSALRETSVISAALIATLLFHEPLGRRRLGPALAVVAGIMLISL